MQRIKNIAHSKEDSESGLPVRTPQDRFDDFLQSRGMRNTQQRRTLLKVVFAEHDHFDAEQLIERLPKKGDSNYVSRPTVYRTLSEFVEAGLLRKFELEGRAVYEHDLGYPEHDHLYCIECRQLTEFHSEQLQELTQQVSQTHQFQIHSHRLIIRGVCAECRQQRRRQRRKVDLI